METATENRKTEGKREMASASGQEIQKAVHALSPFDAMDRLFEGFFPHGWLQPWRRSWPSWGEMPALLEAKMPHVDVIDRDEEIVVRAELPGVEKKDLDISVSDSTVILKGTTCHEEEEEKGDYYRCEISRGAFARSVALPGEVDGAKAKALFKDGMLELTLPKIAKSKRHSIKLD
jgi:HSP20 family protein